MAGTSLFFDIMARDHASAVFNKVGTAADQLGRRTDRAGKSHAAFGKAVRWAGGMLSVYGVGQYLKSSVQEYAKAEAAQNKLGNAYRRFPAMQNATLKSFQDLNTQLMLHTQFDDDDAAAMQANLARFDLTGRQVQKLTPLVADLAQVQGTDMVTAGGRFGKALLGNTRALKDLGISYTATGDKAKDMRNVVRLLNEKVGGESAKAAQTTAVKMAMLGNAWGELKETVGAAVLPAFSKLATVAGPAIADLQAAVSRNAPQIRQAFEDIWDAASKVGRLGKSIWDGFSSMPEGTRQLLLALAGGTWAVGKFKGSALGQGMGSIFSAVKGMNVNAGVVNVNGKVAGAPGAAGPGGIVSKAAAGGVLATAGLTAIGLGISSAIVLAIKAGIDRHYGSDAAGNTRRQRAITAGHLGDGSQRGLSNPSTGGIRQPNLYNNSGRLRAEAEGFREASKQAKGHADMLTKLSGVNTQWGNAAKSASLKGTLGAQAFAGAVKSIPDKKHTDIKANGVDEAKSRVRGLGGAIGSLKGKTVGVKENGAAPSMGRVKGLGGSIGALRGKTVKVSQTGAEQAKAAIDNMRATLALLQSKTININTRYTTSGGGPGKPAMAATGGHITGPGTGTSDSIPLWASNGEFMQPAASVSHYGLGFMEAVRTRRFPRPQGYAKGGKVKAAKRDARRQERLADFIAGQSLSDPSADWFMGLDKAVQKRFMKHPKGIGRFARMAGAVQDRRNLRDAQRSYDQSTQARGLATMSAQDRKNELASRVAATNKELANTKGPAARARLLAKLQDQEEQLAAATSDLSDAQAAQEESAKAAAEAQRELLESQQDAALDKVNALRDAVDGAAGSYRSFASIATTAVTDTAEAQQKLTDATDAVSAAQKKMDLAGNDRERAAAAAELNKALQDQASAQQGVAAAGKPSTGSIRSNMAARLQKLKDFGSAVRSLKAQGLNATTLAEILQMGPEQGYDFAKALLDGGLADINALQNEITAQSADLGYFQYGTDAASAMLTGTAAASAAGLVSNGIVMAPAPVTVSIDGVAIANALIAYSRQNGGSIPGLTS